MAVINDPITGTLIARVGNVAHVPLHVAAGPFLAGNGGAYRISMISGNIGASLAADSEIFQFRYAGASRVCLVHGVAISAGIGTTAPTAATSLSFRMTVARSWTVAGSAGTRATMTGNNQKLRSSHQTSEVNDIGISTTTNLTTGTKTLDAQDMGGVTFGVATGALTVQMNGILLPKTTLFGDVDRPIGYPLVLVNQEGFVVRTGLANPAGMIWRCQVDVAWTETDAF